MSIKELINTAESITTLCDLLNASEENPANYGVDVDKLPVFSDNEPLEPGEVVYSWDENSVLLQDERTGRWFVELRCQCWQAQPNCVCD